MHALWYIKSHCIRLPLLQVQASKLFTLAILPQWKPQEMLPGLYLTNYFYNQAILKVFSVNVLGPVTKTENIKTDATKILRPTHFSGSKNIKTDRFFVGLNLWLFFFQIRLVGLNIYLLFILENKTEALKTDNRVMYTTFIRIMSMTAKC